MANDTTEKDAVRTASQDVAGAAESMDGGSTVPNTAKDAVVAEPQEHVAATAEEAEEDAEASAVQHSDASAEAENSQTSIEELVERKVAEKVSSILPQELEPPRFHPEREEFSSSDYLRLGYGTKSPHV